MGKIGFIAMALCLALASGPVMAAAPQVQYFPHPGGKPFSRAVRVGDLIFVSGAVGLGADGKYPADFSIQTANALNAVAAELALAGATMDNVYNCRVALTNMDNWDAFNRVYKTYFKPDRLPVRMAMGVTSLGGADVEIQCEAVLSK